MATGLTAGEPEPDDTEMLFVKKWKLEEVYEEIEKKLEKTRALTTISSTTANCQGEF